METILQLSRRMAQQQHNNHNHTSSSPSSLSPPSMDMKYSPTESLKLSNSSRDNKRIERRKPNWTEAENVFLLDQFGIHREILTCKATDASTNLKKQEIWRLICQNLNTHNTLVRRTPAEVRRKWKNLVTAAKKEVWEMRHQIHLSGGAGTNGRKISELSQRVLQLHSSGGFSSANPNGLYGTLLSAGLIGPPVPVSGGGGLIDKYGGGGGKYGSSEDHHDKSYIPAHFTPIITLSESNNNHILMGSGHSGGDGPPSPLSDEDQDDNDDDQSSDSRNATEFMSDSGIYEQGEGIDLRVNVSSRSASVSITNGGHNHHGGGVNGGTNYRALGGDRIVENGRRLHNNNNHHNQNMGKSNSGGGDDDEDCDENDGENCDDDEDVEVEDMSLIRFASHLGLRENKFRKSSPAPHPPSSLPINPFITSALLNVNVNNNSRNIHSNINNHRGGGGDLFDTKERIEITPYNSNTRQQPLPSRNVDTTTTSSSSSGNVVINGPQQGNRKSSETTEEISSSSSNVVNRPSISTLNGDLLDATLRLRNHFLDTLKESDLLSTLYKERLELQIEVLKLRKQKLSQELEQSARSTVKKGPLNGLLTTTMASLAPNRARIVKEKNRRRHHFNTFFKLKPKNTWMNFAAKEKLLLQDGDEEDEVRGGDESKKTEPIMTNGINGKDDSDDPEDKR